MKPGPTGDHWFGRHPGKLDLACRFDVSIDKFQRIAQDCWQRGIRVINTSDDSALTCFEFGEL